MACVCAEWNFGRSCGLVLPSCCGVGGQKWWIDYASSNLFDLLKMTTGATSARVRASGRNDSKRGNADSGTARRAQRRQSLGASESARPGENAAGRGDTLGQAVRSETALENRPALGGLGKGSAGNLRTRFVRTADGLRFAVVLSPESSRFSDVGNGAVLPPISLRPCYVVRPCASHAVIRWGGRFCVVRASDGGRLDRLACALVFLRFSIHWLLRVGARMNCPAVN